MSDKKNKVLVVEDDAALLKAVCMKLDTSGYSCLSARSVDEAIKHLTTNGDVDAVWLDHYLPEKNGIELVEYMIRGESPYKNIPVFLVSNTASEDKVENYKHLGVKKAYVKSENRLDTIIADIAKVIAGEQI